ncbi:hypothetical protein ALC62_12188 [Cyphomyrmex costatus]|uniref:Odorant receptor 13a n=1 Tax=Cyphomyrmex costatus TaxID=456900 RepID=A0A195C8Q1_9HYME|nr:hypothetical protein ALC62_12188 [Cyphomyrmex costatus]
MVITSTVSPALKIGLQILGIWPNVSYSTIQWLSIMLSTLIIQCFQYLYIFEHLKISELSNLIDGLTVTLEYSLTLFKLIGLWIHRQVLHQLLAAMDNDWRKCVEIDQHLNVMTIKANISHFYSSVMVSINILAAISYSLGGYAISFVYLPGDHNNTLRQFPIKVQFPLTTQQSPIFELLAVTQFLLILFNSYMLSIITALISTLSKLIADAAYESLWYDLPLNKKKIIGNDTLRQLPIKVQFPFETQQSPIFELLVIILFLHVIIFRQMLVAMDNDWRECINMEEHLYMMTVKANVAYFISNGLLCINAVATVLYLLGEYGKLIVSAAYESPWYDIPSHQSKMLILIIMRSQKQLAITAGKMMDMSLETFTNVIFLIFDHLVFRKFIILGIMIIQYYQYLYIFEHLKISEISNLIDCLNVTISYNSTLFKLIGLWIRRHDLYSTVHFLSIILCTVVIQYFQYLYIFEHLSISEIANLIDSLTVTILYNLTLFKLIGLWIRRQIFCQMLIAMDNDWLQCNMDEHLYMMTIKANVAHFISNSILCANVVVTVLYFSGDYVIRFVSLTDDQNDTLRQLPIKIQLPFETQQSPLFEFLATIHDKMDIFLLTKTVLGFLVSLSEIFIICFAGEHLNFKYFQYLYILEHFSISELSNIIDGLSLALDYSLTFVKLASLWIHRRVFHKILAVMDNDWHECINIDEHLNMMTIKASVSHFYSNAMLSFNGVAAVLYVLGDYAIRFVYSTNDYNDTLRQLPIKVLLPFETEQSPIFELLVAILFLHVIIVSFVVAVLNGLIFTLSKSIADAAYESLWYDMPPHQSKIISFMIMKSQRRLSITAGKMMDMSFEALTTVIFRNFFDK